MHSLRRARYENYEQNIKQQKQHSLPGRAPPVMGRNHPLPNTGVTVINAVPLASGVAEVCYQVAGIESFGVLAYYSGERICTLLPGGLRTPCGVNSATTPQT